MKKILILAVALVGFSTSLSAQTLTNFLKNAATTIIDEVTDGKATESLIVGDWNYSDPAITLKSEDTLAGALGTLATQTIEPKLQSAYDFVGIKAGNCSYSFKADNTFTMVVGKRTLTGTYTYTAEDNKLVMEFNTTLLKLGTMTGYAFITADGLDIVHDCQRLFDFLKALGTKTSLLSGVSKVVENYDGMMIGFSLKK